MNTITFGNLNSYTDFGLILTEKTIDFPKPKLEEVEVEGRNGTIILTKPDEVRYTTGIFHFIFNAVGNQNDFSNVLNRLANQIHGKQLQVKLSWKSNVYFDSVCEINEFTTDKRIGTIGIDVTFQPVAKNVGW